MPLAPDPFSDWLQLIWSGPTCSYFRLLNSPGWLRWKAKEKNACHWRPFRRWSIACKESGVIVNQEYMIMMSDCSGCFSPGIVHHFQSWPQVLDWAPQGPSCQSRQPTHPRFCWKRYPFRILHITEYKDLPEMLRFSIRSPSYHLPGNPSGKYSWSSLLGSPLQKESKERPKCEPILIQFFSPSYPHGWAFIISFLGDRTLVCHDMQGGYVGDHWEEGCQVVLWIY